MISFVPLLAAALAVASPTASPDRAGKHHRLHFSVRDVAHGDYTRPFARFLVGARIPVTVPSFLGTGHGPFVDIYQGALTVRADAGLQLGPVANQAVDVTCTRPGTFELVAIAGGIRDAVDIHCVAPTRITATAAGGDHLLAGASTFGVVVTWFGSVGELVGALPVAAGPGETAIALERSADRLDDVPAFRALHRATRATIVSQGGLRAEFPIDIVEAARWSVAITFQRRGDRLSAFARALDDRGQPFSGVHCALTAELDGTPPQRSSSCGIYKLDARRPGRVCATVLDRTECLRTPSPPA
jgi:hypothetical protein